MTLKLLMDLDPGEENLSEARAVQLLQNALALAGRTSVDELTQIWRTGLEKLAAKAERRMLAKHGHGRRKR